MSGIAISPTSPRDRGGEQLVPGAVAPVDRGLTDAGAVGDVVDPERLDAVLDDQRKRRVEDRRVDTCVAWTAHRSPLAATRRVAWRSTSEGFSVESPDGRIGLVGDIRCSLDSGEANVLVIRCGGFGQRLMIARVAEVEVVIPRQTRLILRPIAELSLQREPQRRTPQLRLIQTRRDGVDHR